MDVSDLSTPIEGFAVQKWMRDRKLNAVPRMNHMINADRRAELHLIFHHLDEHQRGKISVDTIRAALSSVKLSEDSARHTELAESIVSCFYGNDRRKRRKGPMVDFEQFAVVMSSEQKGRTFPTLQDELKSDCHAAATSHFVKLYRREVVVRGLLHKGGTDVLICSIFKNLFKAGVAEATGDLAQRQRPLAMALERRRKRAVEVNRTRRVKGIMEERSTRTGQHRPCDQKIFPDIVRPSPQPAFIINTPLSERNGTNQSKIEGARHVEDEVHVEKENSENEAETNKPAIVGCTRTDDDGGKGFHRNASRAGKRLRANGEGGRSPRRQKEPGNSVEDHERIKRQAGRQASAIIGQHHYYNNPHRSMSSSSPTESTNNSNNPGVVYAFLRRTGWRRRIMNRFTIGYGDGSGSSKAGGDRRRRRRRRRSCRETEIMMAGGFVRVPPARVSRLRRRRAVRLPNQVIEGGVGLDDKIVVGRSRLGEEGPAENVIRGYFTKYEGLNIALRGARGDRHLRTINDIGGNDEIRESADDCTGGGVVDGGGSGTKQDWDDGEILFCPAGRGGVEGADSGGSQHGSANGGIRDCISDIADTRGAVGSCGKDGPAAEASDHDAEQSTGIEDYPMHEGRGLLTAKPVPSPGVSAGGVGNPCHDYGLRQDLEMDSREGEKDLAQWHANGDAGASQGEIGDVMRSASTSPPFSSTQHDEGLSRHPAVSIVVPTTRSSPVSHVVGKGDSVTRTTTTTTNEMATVPLVALANTITGDGTKCASDSIIITDKAAIVQKTDSNEIGPSFQQANTANNRGGQRLFSRNTGYPSDHHRVPTTTELEIALPCVQLRPAAPPAAAKRVRNTNSFRSDKREGKNRWSILPAAESMYGVKGRASGGGGRGGGRFVSAPSPWRSPRLVRCMQRPGRGGRGGKQSGGLGVVGGATASLLSEPLADASVW